MTANKKPVKKLTAKSRKTEAPPSDEIILYDAELAEDDVFQQPPVVICPPSTNNSSESHNSSSSQWAIIGKTVGIIAGLLAAGFGIITGYAWIKEDITKDSKTEIQAIRCAQNEIFKCTINKCSSKELLEKHSECFNK